MGAVAGILWNGVKGYRGSPRVSLPATCDHLSYFSSLGLQSPRHDHCSQDQSPCYGRYSVVKVYRLLTAVRRQLRSVGRALFHL